MSVLWSSSVRNLWNSDDEPDDMLPPTLRFSPTAWAKLVFLRDLGPTEVGGFGLTPPDDLLLVEDIRLVRQRATSVHVAFDDQAVADFFEAQIDAGRKPEQFARIWLHTHPGNSAVPSHVDEATFARAFGRTDWAVMAILARGGQTSARLRFHVGPGGESELPVACDYRREFPASDHAAWNAEYAACVQPEKPASRRKRRGRSGRSERRSKFNDDFFPVEIGDLDDEL